MSITSDTTSTRHPTVYPTRCPGLTPSPPDSYGQAQRVPIHTPVTTTTNGLTTSNPEVYRTNLRPSPSPPDPFLHPRTPGPVDRTVFTTVIVTVLLIDPRLSTGKYYRHPHCLTHPVRGPDVHHERSSTVNSTTVDSQIRVGVLGSSS